MATRTSPTMLRAERDELAARLRLVIARAARGLRQEAGQELTPSQAAVLATVARHGPLTPSELAERERISRPTITRLVARLKALGLIDSVVDPLDRRSYQVELSSRGEALRVDRRARKTAYLARVLEDADPGDLAVLGGAADVLERLLHVERG